jgi:hypothetical protein
MGEMEKRIMYVYFILFCCIFVLKERKVFVLEVIGHGFGSLEGLPLW